MPASVPSQSLENNNSNSLPSAKLFEVWKVMVTPALESKSIAGVISQAIELASPDWKAPILQETPKEEFDPPEV